MGLLVFVSLYKAITKIIVNRLRPHLNNIICPFQSSFLAGRRLTGNVIIAQEVIHSFHKMKNNKNPYMLIKLDLEKAFDCLEWSFIRMMLHSINLPSQLISLIMSCITSSSLSLLIMALQQIFFSLQEGLDKVIQFLPISLSYVWNS